jgi:SMC interacting uncharacterized protein involved in chromosome segregation
MSEERLNTAEKNIEGMRGSLQSLDKTVAVQTERIANIASNVDKLEHSVSQMQSSMEKISQTMSSMQVTLSTMSVTLQQNTDSLKEHIRRTNLLESRIEKVEHWKIKVIAVGSLIGTVGGLVAGLVVKHWI